MSLAGAATWLLIIRGRRLRAQGLKPEGVLPHLAQPQGPKPNPPAKQGSGDSADSSRGLLHVPILRPRGESPPSSNTSPSASGVLGVPLNHPQWYGPLTCSVIFDGGARFAVWFSKYPN